MNAMVKRTAHVMLCLVFVPIAGCATIARDLVQAPRFALAPDQQAELRLSRPSDDQPLGAAVLRVWTRVENPNAFGLTLTRLDGTVLIEGAEAATVRLPLGLPLQAAGDTIVPLDLSIGLADVPGLADVALRAATRRSVSYQLEGTAGVDAGALGAPVFGPMTLVSGEAAVTR